MATNGSTTSLNRKKLIVSALCKHLSLDPKSLPESIAEEEITSFSLTILKSAKADGSPEVKDEVVNWIGYAEGFSTEAQACFGALKGLNDALADFSVLLGTKLKPSETDVIVFDSFMNKFDFGSIFEKIVQEKVEFEFQKLDELLVAKSVGKVETDSNAKKTVESAKSSAKPKGDLNMNKSDAGIKATGEKKADNKGDKKATQEKKKTPEVVTVEKDKEVSVNLLKIQFTG